MCGLGEVLLKGDAGSSDEVKGREELHQSSAPGEKAVRTTDNSAKICGCVLPGMFDRQVHS